MRNCIAWRQMASFVPPDVLAAQVGRMIRSDRSAVFAENFVIQWLELSRLDLIDPSSVGGNYDEAVQQSSRREVISFFNTLLQRGHARHEPDGFRVCGRRQCVGSVLRLARRQRRCVSQSQAARGLGTRRTAGAIGRSHSDWHGGPNVAR